MTPLELFLVVLVGVFGLVIGSFLNVVVYRVPAGIPLSRESRCPQCDSAIKPWHNVPVAGWLALRGRCAACGESIPARYPLVEAFTGIAFAVIAWAFLATTAAASVRESWALGLVIVAFLYFVAISIALTLIDLETHRLPDVIVLPSYVVGLVLFAGAAWLSGEWDALLRGGVGMIALYVFYFVLRLVRPGGMGGGDVKLAGVVGLYLGWVGWGALAVGAFAAFLVGGVVGIALIATRRAGRKTAIPFGPFMLIGAWTGVFAGEALGHAYTSLYSGT
ncbi:prepilin peptidase [Microbacterium flavescens]|uniref:prepilin peptidase n=1 Tax=Microbacterium flavescens TaxID=69366 RepID=UPI0027DCDD34|nr:prepilin peptidase [Microbacterium flavescens]BFF11061.1 A24 family peptidase [Microbacterium flavescens]